MEFIIRTSSNGGTGGAAFGFDVAGATAAL
jgi:hypothetical protein